MGQVLEPLLFGRRTGLSPLSVVLSASFWAFLWGPIGLLIATPLTVGLVVLGRHVPRFEFFDVMLGDRPPLQPEETFYQRALEGDADGLVEQAREFLARGRQLADRLRRQRGAAGPRPRPERLVARGAGARAAGRHPQPGRHPAGRPLRPRRRRPLLASGGVAGGGRRALHRRTRALRPPGRPPRRPRASPRRASAPGRRRARRWRTRTSRRLDPALVRLCLLSVLEEGNSVAGLRYFLRRIARQLPEAKVIVGLWHAPPDSAMLAALREEGPADAIVTSLGEAAALGEALMLRPAQSAG